MITTELKPFLINLADEESDPDEDGVSTPPDEDGPASEPSTEESGNDGFGLDEDMIEAPSVEEF